MTTEGDTGTEVTQQLKFATAAERDAVRELVESLGNDPRIRDSIAVREAYEERPETPGYGIGVVEFFLVIVGTVTLVKLVMEVLDDLGLPGGTIIDARGDGKPVISVDPNLPDDSVTILSKDGKVTYTPQKSTFETVMAVLKEVLISVLSGAKDKASDMAKKVKDIVEKHGGSSGEVELS